MLSFGKKNAACEWKDTISGFPVSPGSAKALVRWDGNVKYVLIAYFLGNIFAKNCCNRAEYVKIIASQRLDVFWDTVYIQPCMLIILLVLSDWQIPICSLFPLFALIQRSSRNSHQTLYFAVWGFSSYQTSRHVVSQVRSYSAWHHWTFDFICNTWPSLSQTGWRISQTVVVNRHIA